MTMQAIVDDYIYIAQGIALLPPGGAFRLFDPVGLEYYSFCDDFGPMNLSSVVSFIEQLEQETSSHKDSRIVYSVGAGKRALTNGAFLLGCYMILKLDMSSQQVSDCFDWLDDDSCEGFRDATYDPDSFRLTLEDCWQGMERGKALGWVKASTDGEQWGMINILEYRHYDDPCNGDFHEVVPGKFIAFKGPVDLGGAEYRDDQTGMRTFSPSALADIFADDFRVAAVVRLNEARYDAASFERRGIRHHHLEFDDCAPPPPAVAAAFLAAADAAISSGGAVAVHCKAGLGRTGTLIALYLMRSEGFAARAAMGWLRVMRPGSVIGAQQDYLCAEQRRLAAPQDPPTPPCPAAAAAAAAPPPPGATEGSIPPCADADCGEEAREGGGRATAGARRLAAAEVAAGMERREAARHRAAGRRV